MTTAKAKKNSTTSKGADSSLKNDGAIPTLGQAVTSHADEMQGNTFCRAIGYGYLTSGLVKVILEQDGKAMEMHFSNEQLDVHIRSLKVVQKLANKKPEE